MQGRIMSKKENLTTKKAEKMVGEHIVIPDGYINIGKNAFSYRSIKSIIIPESVVTIGRQAFMYCRSLEQITIPNNIKMIGEEAFNYCGSLTSITIPDCVILTSTQKSPAFHGCSSLTDILVCENHLKYSCQDGVLFNKDKTTLIRCPEGKTGSYIIPDGVKNIAHSAFHWCDSLTSVTIPNSMMSIYCFAFTSCNLLTRIEIPDNVELISKSAFVFFSDKKSMTATYKGKTYSTYGYNTIEQCRYNYYNLPQEFYDAINKKEGDFYGA